MLESTQSMTQTSLVEFSHLQDFPVILCSLLILVCQNLKAGKKNSEWLAVTL